MANYRAVHSVGDSLVAFLTNSYPAPLRRDFPCTFRVVSCGELAEADVPPTAVTLMLYRVSFDEHLRNTPRFNGSADVPAPLALDLHYLLTVWADKPLAEQVVLGWTLRQMQLNPVLDRSVLKSDAEWQADDLVRVVPTELSAEDMMRIWDTLKPNYRLSVPYVAKVVRIDPEPADESRRVVAARFTWGDSAEDDGP